RVLLARLRPVSRQLAPGSATEEGGQTWPILATWRYGTATTGSSWGARRGLMRAMGSSCPTRGGAVTNWNRVWRSQSLITTAPVVGEIQYSKASMRTRD